MALKHFNPTTPSQRNLVLVDKSALYKGKPVKKLTEGLSKSGGRNNSAILQHGSVVVAISVNIARLISNALRQVSQLLSVWNMILIAPPLLRLSPMKMVSKATSLHLSVWLLVTK